MAIQYEIPFISIRDSYSGITDNEVIKITKRNHALLVTEDKDFGELVFAHGYKTVSVLLIRYDKPKYVSIEPIFLELMKVYNSSLKSVFMVLSEKRLRKREI